MSNSIPTNTDPTEMCSVASSRGIVLGIYSDPDDNSDPGVLTPTGWYYNKVSLKWLSPFLFYFLFLSYIIF